MNKKIFYLLTIVTVLVLLCIAGILAVSNSSKENAFTTEKLNISSRDYKKINDKVSEPIKENGVYLLNTGEKNVTYLILDGSHISLKNEVPYFSNIKIEKKGNSIMIYFSKALKTYSEGNFPEPRLIYKITKGTGIEYIMLFKNGEETHFDSVIGA